ncbi:glycerol-3-phosphate dehydrogenase/oxidase [Luteolibacter flavescens]|uniref:Glycerol-3-phosphate dehydrogenase/oxidase n=1 Tax=Luteolibacter flavescens TaxID=1859460 RepID=A0ABT3FKY0_9BACT|nr:glycerol-3-phosphate dehydrogenase/oxidase [Luteolibacter flavescens]MCW1884246.1 glycerol-3-phosphate dehydrogenase/oxidase [Luteolibacter flavescens]
MNRPDHIAALESESFDLCIVGGGATGLGAAVDAAARGYRVALVEQTDFAKGTSSRSTKLVHGGVRYLKQGNVSLVLDALRERGRLARNAPHLVKDLPFVIPTYHWWEGPFYGIGMKVYDALAGKLGFGASHHLSKEETLARIPTIEPDGLTGGVIYHDGQFDDARLAIHLAMTADDLGAKLANHVRCVSLVKESGKVRGIEAVDLERGRSFRIAARAVINATGVFVDELRRRDEPSAGEIVAVSQGVHLVLPKDFLPGDSAIMIPKTADGRVLFAVPWHDRVVLGTTDTPLPEKSMEPRALPEEIDFLMTHAARYLSRDPRQEDVLSVFAGLRPLVKAGGGQDTASLSRDHTILISESGLITITGGKWTTYRKMAEDVIDRAADFAGLEEVPCRTAGLPVHGATTEEIAESNLRPYGSDAARIHDMGDTARLHPSLELTAGEVRWHAREEMARTAEDVLARRSRSLLLDARGSMDAAPAVAAILAEELGRDGEWQSRQVEDFRRLASGYLLGGAASS